MREGHEEEALIFLHVPKTAGTVVKHVIARLYRPEEVMDLGVDAKGGVAALAGLDETARNRIRVVHGHAPFGTHEVLARPARYFTILREPVDRVLSFYYYVARRPDHYHFEFVRDAATSPRAFVESGTSTAVDNFAVRMISGAWHDVPYGELERSHLDQARQNIDEHFAMAGVQDRFDETLLWLAREAGWRDVFYVPLNATVERESVRDLSAADRRAIASQNALDAELYEWVAQRQRERVAELGVGFALRRRSFSLANPLVGRLLRRDDDAERRGLGPSATRAKMAATGSTPKRTLVPRFRRPQPSTVPDDGLATEADVHYCYRLLLGREPDESGLASHLRLVRKGIATDDLVRSFVTSTEFANRFRLGAAEEAQPPEPVAIGDLTVLVASSDWAIGRALRGAGDYEPHVWRVLSEALEAGRDFVDVGANVGLIALRAAKEVGPAGRVFAIEASARNCVLLEQSAAMNELSNVEVLPIAAGNRRGMVGYRAHGSNGELATLDEVRDALAEPVPILPLDDVLPHDADVAAMKVDVEGAEALVFEGAAQTLQRCRPILFFELTPHVMLHRTGVDADTLLSRIVSTGYEIRRLARDEEEGVSPAGFTTDVSALLSELAAHPEPHDLMARPTDG